jgi:ABC-type lipoprotein release transport system permease subunit
MVSEGFCEAMGLRLLRGRTFRPDDGPGAENVVVLSGQLARRHFPDRDPVGQRLYSPNGHWRVVGVVADVRPAAPGEAPVPTAYVPLRQNTAVLQWFATANVVVRGAEPRRLAAAVRAVVLSLDPETPPFDVRALDDDVSEVVAGPRFSAALLAVFALVALVMASVGVYGVVSYSAGLRTREIGVRMALGATRAQIVRLIVRDGAIVVAIGLAAGMIASRWLAQALVGLLHEVTPADPVAFVAVAVLLSLAGLVAAYVPARRATSADPLDALREQ